MTLFVKLVMVVLQDVLVYAKHLVKLFVKVVLAKPKVNVLHHVKLRVKMHVQLVALAYAKDVLFVQMAVMADVQVDVQQVVKDQ